MKKLILILIILLNISCKYTSYDNISNKLEVRQLINKEITTKYSHASYFLIVGSYDSYENRINYIKTFVKVDSSYTLFQCRLEDLNINIHNKDEKPYFIIEKLNNSRKLSDYEMVKDITDDYYWKYKITLYCNEKYLPEQLLPIILN